MSLEFLIRLVVIVGGSAILFGCEQCSECSNDYEARFRFVDSSRTEILKDVNSLSIVDFNGYNYLVKREASETDTFFVASFVAPTSDTESPDTVLFLYDNALIDSVGIDYTYSSDSRCCNNTFLVGRLNFLNRNAARRIKTEYSIYDVILD